MPRLFQIRFTHNIMQVYNHYSTIERVTIPQQFERDAEDAGRVLVTEIRKYIPGIRLAPGQKKPSTGRLHASFGIPDPSLTHNPAFNPDEAIFRVEKRGDRMHVTVGTSVKYAAPQDEGFVHYISKRFIPGYHFTVRGAADAEPIIKQYFKEGVEKAIGDKKSSSVRKRFQATAQPRTPLGHFSFKR